MSCKCGRDLIDELKAFDTIRQQMTRIPIPISLVIGHERNIVIPWHALDIRNPLGVASCISPGQGNENNLYGNECRQCLKPSYCRNILSLSWAYSEPILVIFWAYSGNMPNSFWQGDGSFISVSLAQC